MRTALNGLCPAERAACSPLVLIIDDSATVRKVVEVALQRASFAVQPFPDGPSALRWLARPSAPKPALIFLDIEMPGMDGYTVARTLHELPALNQIPLIMISCRDGLLDRLKSRLVGAQWYVTKPFQVEKLVEVTRLALGSGSQV